VSAVVAVAVLACATSADAGSYVIDNCPAAPAHNGDAGPWLVFGSTQSNKASCGGGEGDWIGPRGGTMSAGTVDGVQVTAPAGSGITIRAARVWWYVPQQISGATTFALAGTNGGGVGESGTPLERRSTPDVFTLPSSSTTLVLDDYCSNDDAGYGCVFGAGENPNLQLFGSQLTLGEQSLPTGSVTGGGLAGPASLSGTQSLAYHAEDAESGVRLARLMIDGQPVAVNDYAAGCPYANFAACSTSKSDVISWNTALVPDGQHRLELTVGDAAQNTAVIYAATITTQNAAPSSPSAPGTALTGVATSALQALTVGQSGAAAPNGSGAAHGAQLRLNPSHDFSRTFASRAVTLSGALKDAGGQPIGGATLDVREQAQGSTSPTVIGHVSTGPNGSFTARVAAGPSRLLLLNYRAFSNDPAYSTQSSILESVGAGVRMHITPRRTSATGSIAISGQVAGPVPRRGVVVELLVHYRGRWEPFRDPRTDARGRFHIRYQFEGALGRFPFRAEVLGGQSGFPYATGASAPVQVTTG
jgi:hypothetical protein